MCDAAGDGLTKSLLDQLVVLAITSANHSLSKTARAGGIGSKRQEAVLEGLGKEAPAVKNGLWADPQPVPPWEWRKKIHNRYPALAEKQK
jgi:hypothetical protein